MIFGLSDVPPPVSATSVPEQPVMATVNTTKRTALVKSLLMIPVPVIASSLFI
jgi:hypothetical protein